MPTYVSLENWTDQGIKTVKNLPQRIDGAVQLAQKYGCGLQLYWTNCDCWGTSIFPLALD